MEDLTDLMKRVGQVRTWSRNTSLKIATAYAAQLSAELDWDDGAGEDWARLLDDDQVLAIICMDRPLIFTFHDVPPYNAEVAALHCVQVDDIDDVNFSCDLGTLMAVFPVGFPMDDWDSDAFSAGDLWWATI